MIFLCNVNIKRLLCFKFYSITPPDNNCLVRHRVQYSSYIIPQNDTRPIPWSMGCCRMPGDWVIHRHDMSCKAFAEHVNVYSLGWQFWRICTCSLTARVNKKHWQACYGKWSLKSRFLVPTETYSISLQHRKSNGRDASIMRQWLIFLGNTYDWYNI